MELSIISSLTKKKAWSNSVIHPRMLRCLVCSGFRGSLRAIAVSGTERPRLSLPPGTLTFKVYESEAFVLVNALGSRNITK